MKNYNFTHINQTDTITNSITEDLSQAIIKIEEACIFIPFERIDEIMVNLQTAKGRIELERAKNNAISKV